MEDQYLTVEELSKMLKVSTKTVYRLMKHGGLPAHRIGHNWRFERRAVSQWIFKRRIDQLRDTG